ncbi:DUF2264 domain-containing protein [Mucilaginibacter sp. AW1-3]
MKRRTFLKNSTILGVSPVVFSRNINMAADEKIPAAIDHRKLWLDFLMNLTEPVLTALAADQLREKMPVEMPEKVLGDRSKYSHLEAMGRLLSGIAPWLQLEDMNAAEKKLRDKYFALAVKGIGNAVNPSARDYMNWDDHGTPLGQSLVDASYVAYAFIRCPRLWQALDSKCKKQALECLRSTRKIRSGFNNWILFSAMIETFFLSIGEEYDIMRIDYALRQHAQWYQGGGFYNDGPHFSLDYYNSFVIHPYMHEVLNWVAEKDPFYLDMKKDLVDINRQYAIIQEQFIAPDGTYPLVGRSIVYRTAAFQHLANTALKKTLPKKLTAPQVRCALSAVITKVTSAPGLYDKNGWLQLGVYGHQPLLADIYVSTGSLYICSNILLPLGLPESDEFWAAPDEDWSSKKIWAGVDVPLH